MTHLSDKPFNTYKEGLDLNVQLWNCLDHGKVRTFQLAETLEEALDLAVKNVEIIVGKREKQDIRMLTK